MLRLIKRFSVLVLFAVFAPTAWGFALLGPLPATPNEPDGWQQPVIDYGINVLFGVGFTPGGPKNLGEEYRRNTRVMYYAYNVNFLDFFGTNAATSIDGAFDIFNALTNVSSYSSDLSEFPLNTKNINYTAQSLGLTDMKSFTLGVLADQMGLADPVRYAWTLRERNPGPACPFTATYRVIQRNFDIVSSPLNQVQYSPYVNDTLYSYHIFENCTGPNPLAGTIPFTVDPYADAYTPVASFNTTFIDEGAFYTGLTRDDVAGLRYMWSSNNVNMETAAFIANNGPNVNTATGNSGVGAALLLTTNNLPQQVITTQPLSDLLTAAQTNTPAGLQALFPGLIIATSTNYLTSSTVTNYSIIFTNQPGPAITNFLPIFSTNTTLDLGLLITRAQTLDPASLVALYPGLVVSTVTNVGISIGTNITAVYTNQPGPALTNYDYGQNLNPPPNRIVPPPGATQWAGTEDFELFAQRALTNTTGLIQNIPQAIQQLNAFYPDLVIVSAIPYPSRVVTTNFATTFVHPTGSPVGTSIQVTYIDGIFTNNITRYNYVFGNLLLYSNESFYPLTTFNGQAYPAIDSSHGLYVTNETVTNITTIVGQGLPGSPYPSIGTNFTQRSVIEHNPVGSFFLMPTNWCGFSIDPEFTILTKLPSYTNLVNAGFTNATLFESTNIVEIHYYTNAQLWVRPGVCEPTLSFATNYTTNAVITYENTLLNVFTNYYAPTSQVATIITNITTTNGATAGTTTTNILQTTAEVNVPTGDFLIIPTNWCGFSIVARLLTNVVYTTNTLVVGPVPITIPPDIGGTATEQYSQTTITSATNHVFVLEQGVCEPALITNQTVIPTITTNFAYTFVNVFTNNYSPTSTVTVVTTNIFTTNGAPVGVLFTNVTTNTLVVNVPSGDFFIIPTNWCNFSIVSTLFTNVNTISNTFLITSPLLNTPGSELFSQTTNLTFNTYTLLIAPQSCSETPFSTGLYQGIEDIKFVRANYDSLIGQFFQPITNEYSMVMVTNSQLVTQHFRRIINEPDILLTAADTTSSALVWLETTPNYDKDNVYNGLAGPGSINPTTTITYNKAGPIYANDWTVLATDPFIYPAFGGAGIGETNQAQLFVWGSFDGSTNTPVIYPNGTSIDNLINQLLVQISPTTLADGTAGVAYGPVTFTATGGSFQPPFTWSASGLPAGLTMSSGGVLSGTPTQSGTFDIVVTLTDSLARSVQWNYTITIN